jgi:hypothetical protein
MATKKTTTKKGDDFNAIAKKVIAVIKKYPKFSDVPLKEKAELSANMVYAMSVATPEQREQFQKDFVDAGVKSGAFTKEQFDHANENVGFFDGEKKKKKVDAIWGEDADEVYEQIKDKNKTYFVVEPNGTERNYKFIFKIDPSEPVTQEFADDMCVQLSKLTKNIVDRGQEVLDDLNKAHELLKDANKLVDDADKIVDQEQLAIDKVKASGPGIFLAGALFACSIIALLQYAF